ncbi:ATP-binding cassette domain-containing protein [Liquorilactobacillus nagelii]|jgi:teichoic acid transport system ATP-binding protein|nr:ATP-binding cassette domain-containing protein [Liquorilactobacillus nagelii]
MTKKILGVKMKKIEIKYITKEQPLITEKKESVNKKSPLAKNKSFWPLQGVSLTVNPGEAVGLIGINGSGKRTLTEILAGRLKQTTGFTTLNAKINYASSRAGLDENFTGLENIKSQITKMDIDEFKAKHLLNGIIDFCELGNWLERPVREYSVGMYARLSLTIAMFTEPEMIVLDNVLNALDIPYSQQVNQKLQELKDSGVALLVADVNLVNVERFCERTLWLQFGKVQQLGPTPDVMLQYEYFQDWLRNATLPEKNKYFAKKKKDSQNFDIAQIYEEFKVEQFKHGFTRKDEPKMRRAFFKERGADPVAAIEKNAAKKTPANKKKMSKRNKQRLIWIVVLLGVIGLGSWGYLSQANKSKLKSEQKTTLTSSEKRVSSLKEQRSSKKKQSSLAASKAAASSKSVSESSVKAASAASESSAKAASASSASESSLKANTQTINVNSGDTLEGLAEKYATDVNTIKKINNISSEADLKAGSVIRVPK